MMPTAPPIIGDPVLVEARQILADVQASLQQVFTAGDGGIRRARDVCKVFGVQTTLGWSLFRAATADDPLEVVHHLPGPNGMAIFLKAAERRRLPPPLIGQAQVAFARFEQLVTTHAGDRDMLEMMLADESTERFQQVEQACRKAGFVAGSFLAGVQSRMKIACCIIYPGADDGVDVCMLNSTVDLRRLRPDVTCAINIRRVRDEFGTSNLPVPFEPLETAPKNAPPELVAAFSSSPLPRIRSIELEKDEHIAELVGWPVGIQGAVTVTFAYVLRGAAERVRSDRNSERRITTEMRTPCELLIRDHLVHPDLSLQSRPMLEVFNRLPLLSDRPGRRERYPVRVSEQVRHLGHGERAAALMEMPSYPELLRWAFDKLGWDLDVFDVYRARMEYPPIPTSIDICYPLPDRSL